jgi:hypothetical protein
MKLARELIGESDPGIRERSNNPWFPPNLVQVINKIISSPSNKMQQPSFKFKLNQKAAVHNWKILQEHNLNLDRALNAQQSSQLQFGSEFRETQILEPLLQKHPLWNRLKDQLDNGASFPLEELSSSERKLDVAEALEFGNHKGADKNEELFKEMMQSDVDHGYSLVTRRSKVTELKDAVISPMNIADQSGINKKGEIILKKQLTHNQSMTYLSGTSVNNRTQKDELQDVMYGSCLSRVIHQIVEYQNRFPGKRILTQKVDFKAAYCRTHLHPTTAIQTITQFVAMSLCFISLRLTFGGAPNPNYWSEVSETITDLINALLSCRQWNPLKIKSPLQTKVPKLQQNIDPRPFTKALPTSVQIKVSNMGQTDCYIDDLTTTTVEIGDNVERAAAATLLAIHTIGRPVDNRDPIKRLDLVSMSKLQAEAALEESKILLGWKLDMRALLVSLPFKKFKAWTNSINEILTRNKTTFKELETLIGRLGHITVVMHPAKHFMS